jgi:hypothetical protein
MENKRIIPKTLKFLFCFAFITIVTGTAFGQFSELALYPSDTRFEPVYSNDIVIGYNLFVRKGPGMESVMLTEPSGSYALRSMEWNPVNGSERRELSGVPLSGAYSSYSILSSTSIDDWQFGRAFHLFIPSRVVFGSPTSSAGIVFINISSGVQINIRTFDHKYGDPTTGRFQNNLTLINTQIDYILSDYPIPVAPIPRPAQAEPPTRKLSRLIIELREIIANKEFLDRMEDEDLEIFLINAFWEKEHGPSKN